jgi:hypothetical protein
MDDFINARYIAARFKVSPATVYMWMKESGNPNWGHEPIPQPVARLYNGYGTEDCLLIWSADQLPEWDGWYAEYEENKTRIRSALMKAQHAQRRADAA